MKISMIAACDRNNVIGKGNELPWRLPADLENFKALTLGKIIIMGRKTWESLGCKPLPKRKTIIITTDPRAVMNVELPHDNGVVACPSILTALQAAQTLIKEGGYPEEVMVIGGAVVYHQFIKLAETIYLSRIDTVVEDGDAFFPEIDRDLFQLNLNQTHTPDGDKHTMRWTYQLWNRITN